MAKSVSLRKSAYAEKKSAPLRPRDTGEVKEVYGLVLGIRALGEVAVRLRDRPAAALVLMQVYSHMNGKADRDPSCKVGRSNIASALGMTRQAVQQHLAVLKAKGILVFESSSGDTTTFSFAPALLEPLRTQRPRQKAIDEGRARRKAERKAAKASGKPASGHGSADIPGARKPADGRQRAPTTPDEMHTWLVKKYGQENAGHIVKVATKLADDAGISIVSLLTRFGIHKGEGKWKMEEVVNFAATCATEEYSFDD